MMTKLCLSFLLLTGVASAQLFEVGGFGGSSRLSSRNIGTYQGYPVELDNGWLFGFRTTLNSWPFFGHEFGYTYNRTHFILGAGTADAASYGTAIHQGGYNFLAYFTPEGSKVRPFVTGGGHFASFVFPGLSVSSGGGDTKYGYNYGGGIKVKVSDRFLIRFDYRRNSHGKPFDFPDQSGRLIQNQISMGWSFYL